MVQQTKREYLAAILKRYANATRQWKRQILDEFCVVCGYHRKHAIRLLNRKRRAAKRKPGRPARYGAAERNVLEVIWLTANRPCSKRLKAALALWLPHYERQEGAVSEPVRKLLLDISPRSLDRLMTLVRRKHGSRGRCGTRPGSLLRHQIPIQTDLSDIGKPGTIEADTVAHCGQSMDGSFVWSLTMTDIFSGWTVNRAVWNKGYEGVQEAIADIEERLPFDITGFHCDNGGEFLNHHLIHYFSDRKTPVGFSRGRPYHKNDTAHVEQKNYTHVRMMLGYSRIDDPKQIPTINELYRAWELFNNLFSPSVRLIKKEKIGSRYIKHYDLPQTPAQRLLASPDVKEAMKTHITELLCNHDPFKLKRYIDQLQGKILNDLR